MQTFEHWHSGSVFICDVGGSGLISHKFGGTGEGGAGMCTEGRPRSCAGVHGAAGCEPGVQLAVARWARLAAGWVHNGRAAGGCPMGQAGSWAGAQWACSWRLPDGPGCQLGGCTMDVQLAVARWARLAAGRVHNGRSAGGCPMGQAGSWACYGYPGALPRMPDTHDMQAQSIFHTKIMMKASDVAQIIYIFRYHISTVLYMRISKA